MMDPDDSTKKPRVETQKTDQSAGPDVIADDEVLDADDADIEYLDDADLHEEETTGKFEVPDLLRRDGASTAEDASDSVLDEDSFEDDTGEAEFEDDTGRDSVGDVSGDDLDDTDRGVLDTHDEPLATGSSSRRRRRSTEVVKDAEEVFPEDRRDEAEDGDPWSDEGADEIDESPGRSSLPDKTPPEGSSAPWARDEESDRAGTERAGEAFPHNDDPAQEKTLIFGEGEGVEEDAPAYPYVVVIQGEEEGREIELIPDEVSIGRGADNDLVFPDIACSRRHALLERKSGTFVVHDLGSGNGTMVNGRKIQKAELHDGDEIHVGSTILQFNLPGAPEPGGYVSGTVTNAQTMSAAGPGFVNDLLSDPRKRKLVLFGGGGVLGFFLILLIVKVFAGPSGPPPQNPQEVRRKQQVQARREFEDNMQAAKRLVTEKKWKDAGLKIQLALKINPDDKLALEYKKYLERELSSSRALQVALDLMEKKQFDLAVTQLNQIAEESNYYGQAKKLKVEIEEKITDDLIEQGKNLMGQKQFAQAVIKFDDVLRRNSDNAAAAQLKREAEEKLGIEQNKLDRLTYLRRNKKRKHGPAVTKRPSHGLTGRVLALYRNGEIDKAIEKTEESGASKEVVKLKKFKAVYRKGMELAKNIGQISKAVDYLSRALKLDKDISGGSGSYHDKIRGKLSKANFIQGVDAFMGHRYPESYKCFKTALSFGNERSKQKLQDLERIAKKLYEEAYVIKSTSPDQAIKKLSTVLKIIPPGHVYFGKAKKLRAEVQGPIGNDSGGDTGF
ncbi:MAG TPA: FHA domain-containing protein [Myxococcota bacterium]|nr:FHA domain-containing protein [Myxococcota bacterium]